jgi:hypothetical protein
MRKRKNLVDLLAWAEGSRYCNRRTARHLANALEEGERLGNGYNRVV